MKRQSVTTRRAQSFGWRYLIAVVFAVLLLIAVKSLGWIGKIVQTGLIDQYPYRFPFSLIVGILSSVLAVVLFVLNIALVKRYNGNQSKGEILVFELLLSIPGVLFGVFVSNLTVIIAFIAEFW